jgi:hypothetical protein
MTYIFYHQEWTNSSAPSSQNPLYTDVTYLAADFTHVSLAMLASPSRFHGLANQLSLGAVEM